MKKLILVIAIILLPVLSKSQVFPDSLYLHLFKFQVLKDKYYPDQNIEKLKDVFTIKELVEHTNTAEFQIFKFSYLYENLDTSILIVENNNFEIYDILSFIVLIERIIDTPDQDEKSKTLWIKEVLKILHDSYREDRDIEKFVLRRDFGKYHYFIPLMNLTNPDGNIKKYL